MFCIASAVMLALMLVPIAWVHGWKMEKVNHDARDHCIVVLRMVLWSRPIA